MLPNRVNIKETESTYNERAPNTSAGGPASIAWIIFRTTAAGSPLYNCKHRLKDQIEFD